VKTIWRLVRFAARFVEWLAGRLGLWRIDAVVHLARALECAQLAAQLEAAGLPGPAQQLRHVAACRRAAARRCIPPGAPAAWHAAAA